jgi:hypothetical protein
MEWTTTAKYKVGSTLKDPNDKTLYYRVTKVKIMAGGLRRVTAEPMRKNPSPPISKWIPAKAVKFNRNGSVSIRKSGGISRKSNPRAEFYNIWGKRGSLKRIAISRDLTSREDALIFAREYARKGSYDKVWVTKANRTIWSTRG